MRALVSPVLIVAVTLSLCWCTARADWTQQAKLTAGDAAAYDYLGCSVSVSGDYGLAGAYGESANRGAAYVFYRDGTSAWSQQAKLTATDAALYDYFGEAAAISGDYCAVAAGYDDDMGSDSGSVYVFSRSGTTWTQQAKLKANDGAGGDYFGCSVAISGDSIVVGARADDDGGSGSGSAYVFTRSGSNWNQQAKLTATDAAAGDWFGYSVSISGDTVVAGAVSDADKGTGAGSAYVFTRSGSSWTQQTKLLASDGAAWDAFGRSVGISDDDVVVGAKDDDDKGLDSGSAYVFHRDGSSWSEQAKLTAADGAGSDYFGNSVGIDGDSVVVGAYGDDDAGSASGAAYLFTRAGAVGTWTQAAKLVADDAAGGDYLGWRVGIDADTVIAGAYQETAGGTGAGAAYIYVPEPATAGLLLAAGACLLLRRRRRR